MLASNNGLKRLTRKLKRRDDVMQILPNDASVVRPMGATLTEQFIEGKVARKQGSIKCLIDEEIGNDTLLAGIARA